MGTLDSSLTFSGWSVSLELLKDPQVAGLRETLSGVHDG